MASRPRAARYGIAEWFGHSAQGLSTKTRQIFAHAALKPGGSAQACPFALSVAAPCNKPGGVCSIRQYQERSDGSVRPAQSRIATVCPNRFLENAKLLRWAGEVMLSTHHPILVKEVPFLAKLTKSGVETATRKAGRIDWVLVDPNASDALRWCAMETQSVYFSGKKMETEYANWARAAAEELPFPVETRRPDYRSSGPKRLAPQLRVKVPELRSWGAKTCVLVDRYFYEQMSDLASVKGVGANQLANAEVVWQVADYDSTSSLVPGEVIYSRLEESIAALNATESVGKVEFERAVRDAIDDPRRRGSKVFTV